jgi:hypothetical protein
MVELSFDLTICRVLAALCLYLFICPRIISVFLDIIQGNMYTDNPQEKEQDKNMDTGIC